jgi:hypothetical protein
MNKRMIAYGIFLNTLLMVLAGCDDGIAALFHGPEPTTVAVVTVSPATANVAKGGTQTFTATVTGNNNPTQTVTWSVDGGAGASISAGGVLTVAASESAERLTVRATSTADTAKSGTAEVTIPTVQGVTVSPPTASLAKGGTATFSAVVTGTGNPAQTVTWSVDGGGAGTTISASGVLSVAASESAATLTVRATSTVDTAKSGTATVTVTVSGGDDPVPDTRVTLGAGIAVNAEAADTTATVSFTGATGSLTLTASDFAVNNGATVTGVSLSGDTAMVSVNFLANLSTSPKTYTVSIASDSTKIKGSGTVTITQAAATGSAGITVGFAYSDITISGNDGTNSISKSGANKTLTLSAVGYTGVVWYVDADTTGISGNRVTLNAADYTAQRHSITFTGQKDGRRYSSRPIPFTVLP